MKPDNIDQLTGRELDAAVAVELGWEWREHEGRRILLGPVFKDQYSYDWQATYWPDTDMERIEPAAVPVHFAGTHGGIFIKRHARS